MSISMGHRTLLNTLAKMLAPQEGMKITVSSPCDDTSARVANIFDQTIRPPETKNAQEIVDMLDSVSRLGSMHPR